MNASKKTPAPASSPAKKEEKKAPAPSAPVATLPAPAPTAAKDSDAAPAFLGSRSALGFGSATRSAFIEAALVAGTSRADIFAGLRSAFAPGKSDDSAEVKGLRTTLAVFLSDSRRPFFTYSASRSLEISEEGGKLRVSPASYARAAKAVEGGILSEARKAKTEAERKALLSRFGLPSEPKKA